MNRLPAASGIVLGVLLFGPILQAGFDQAPGSPYPVGTNPLAIATADFNRDGYRDLVTANVNSATISVLLGTGSGSFVPAPGSPFLTFDPTVPYKFSIGGHPRDIVVGDFNGDGRADLAALCDEPLLANQNGTPDLISVLMGDGSGGFAPPILSRTGPTVTSLAVADFNSDTIDDLAVTNALANSLSTYETEVRILLGDRTGIFDFDAAGGTGIRIVDRRDLPGLFAAPFALTVGDFDNDGNADLAFSNPVTRDVSVWLGNGAAEFVSAPGSPMTMPLNAFAGYIAPGDFNADGITDLAVSHGDFSIGSQFLSLTVLLGTGTGAFVPTPSSPFRVSFRGTFGVAIGDFNVDGHADIAAGTRGIVGAQPRAGDLSILYGNGTGQFRHAAFSPIQAPDPHRVVVADFNGDGMGDVAAANTSANSVTVLLGKLVPDTTAPRIFIGLPGEGHVFSQNQIVDASYGCQDELDGSGVASCVGTVPSGTPFNTATIGHFTFTVTSTDNAGNVSFATTNYRVIDITGPVINITAPSEGAVYALNQVINANYTCEDELGGSGVAACDGQLPSGTPLDTATPGIKTFLVTASDNAGNMSGILRHYQVRASPETLIVQLIEKTLAFVGHPGLKATLKARLEAVAAALVQKKPALVCSGLSLYILAINGAPVGSGLTPSEKSELVGDANRIKVGLGCS